MSNTRTADTIAEEAVACFRRALRNIESTDPLEGVLSGVVDAAIELTGAERAYLTRGEDLSLLEHHFRNSRPVGGSRVSDVQAPLSSSVTRWFARLSSYFSRRGDGTVVRSKEPDTGTYPPLAETGSDVRTTLAVPLPLRSDDMFRGRDQLNAGVLYVERIHGSLDSCELALQVLAQQASILIQDLRCAAQLQQSLLPPMSRSGAFYQAAACSLPCRALGGDFFDYVDLPSGDFGFTVCDVAGKGAPAALLSAVVQGILAAVACIPGGPAATLSRINGALIRRPIDSRFATVLYGVLCADGNLIHSNGGHNAPFLLTRSTVRRLDTGGPVLGIFETAHYEEEATRLEPGDLLAVFSDGVTEALNAAGEEFGDERLLACLSANRSEDPQIVLDALFRSVREFREGTPQTDDITALILRYAGSSTSQHAMLTSATRHEQ